MTQSHSYVLPDFDLDEPVPFNAAVLADTPIDRFVLSLCLAFNDLKDILWLQHQLNKGTPVSPQERRKSTGYNGQLGGMKIYTTRLLCAITFKILSAIKENRQVWENDPDMTKSLRGVPRSVRRDWERIVEASEARPNADAFMRFIVTVRNNIAYHYYKPKQLMRGYKHFFDSASTDENRQKAYVSTGRNMEATRFYFADAAAQGLMELQVAPAQFTDAELADHVRRFNNVLVTVIVHYLGRRFTQFNKTADP